MKSSTLTRFLLLRILSILCVAMGLCQCRSADGTIKANGDFPYFGKGGPERKHMPRHLIRGD